jgi:hypothetical protein
MIAFTVFKSIFDNKTDTKVEFDSFEKFEKSLYHLSTLKGYKAKKGERTPKGVHPSPLISPAVYTENSTRANANVIEWAGWAAIDVDNHVFEGNLQDELYSRYGEWYYVCYSTASSTVVQPRFRLVFPLTEHVPQSTIKHFWYALNAEFGSIGDGQTKDLSRMYYVPAQYPGANNFIFTNAGNYIDPNVLMAKHEYKEPKALSFIDGFPENFQKDILDYRQNELLKNIKDIQWSSYKDCPFVNARLINEYKSIASQDGSGRYSMIYKIMTSIACNAIKRRYPINEYEITQLILQLDRETTNRYQHRPLSTEAARAIAYAYKTVTPN